MTRPWLPAVALACLAGAGFWFAGPAARREEAGCRVSRLAMGTLASVWLPVASGPAARAAAERALDEMARLETLMSDYRPDSELSELNRRAGGDWLKISADTFEVLSASLAYARATGGAFDPTCLPLMRLWGFRTPPPGAPAVGRPPSPAELERVLRVVGHAGLELDATGGRARLSRSGAALDLGAIAKGHAVDRAAALLRAAGFSCFQVDLGGNLAVGQPPPGQAAWRIGIKDPTDPSTPFAVLALAGEAVATSGGGERFVVLGGERFGHVMDPRKGKPVEGPLSSTVVAPTAMAADALSTVVQVLGLETTAALLARERAAALVLLGPAAAPRLAVSPALEARLELAPRAKRWR